MNKEMEKRLHDCMMIQTASYSNELMIAYIEKFVSSKVKEANIEYDDYGNVYVTKGESEAYPCMVAHTDTVHKIYDGFNISKSRVINEGKVESRWSATCYNKQKKSRELAGIGGDDKVGIFLALEILLQFDNIKVAFFKDEEVGCIGSSKADMSWFDNVGYCFQGDRRGNNEIIRVSSGTELFGKEFSDKISLSLKSHKYEESYLGSLTDVLELTYNGVGVCTANIGCGYYNAHTVNEYIVLQDVFNCFKLTVSMIKALGENRYEHECDDYYGYVEYYKDHDYSSGSLIDDSFYKTIEVGDLVYEIPSKIKCPCVNGKDASVDDELNYTCSGCNMIIYRKNDVKEALGNHDYKG